MRILLVDDEEHLVTYLKKALEAKHYTVEVRTNGQDALSFIELNHALLDLIILDISLPKFSGLYVCKKIRAQGITTPVIILTARTTVDDKVLGLDIGADDYLSKPFAVKELLARMRALLRRPKNIVPKSIKIQDIEIWPEKRKIYKAGQEVFLTLREFELLHYLLIHPNEVIDRERIVDKVWDMNFSSFSNVVDVHIKNLRKKLITSNGKSVIETIRGVGYRINL